MNAQRSLGCLVLAASAFVLMACVPQMAYADQSPPADPLLEAPVTLPEPSRVLVHVASAREVQLEYRGTGEDAWTVVCRSPCDRDLALDGAYRFVYGSRAEPGDAFRLSAPKDGAITLTVRPPSKVKEHVGNALLGVGGALALVSAGGLVLLATSPATPCGDSAAIARGEYADGGMTCGGGFGRGLLELFAGMWAVAGGGMVLSGVLVRSTASARTIQSSTPSARTTRASAQKGVFAREPTWVAPRAVPSAKPGFLIPLSLSF